MTDSSMSKSILDDLRAFHAALDADSDAFMDPKLGAAFCISRLIDAQTVWSVIVQSCIQMIEIGEPERALTILRSAANLYRRPFNSEVQRADFWR